MDASIIVRLLHNQTTTRPPWKADVQTQEQLSAHTAVHKSRRSGTGYTLPTEQKQGFTPALETVQESLARLRYMWKTLAGLRVLLDSCFRRKDGCWFLAQSP